MQIKGFEKVLYITSFKLHKKRDNHSICSFSAVIKENSSQEYFSKVGKEVCVKTEDNMPIFYGIIQSVNVEESYTTTKIEVSAISNSIFIDKDKKYRIFQNPKKTYGDILSSKRLSLDKCELTLASDIQSKVYSDLVVQNGETDFEFINRLSKYSQTDFWVIDTLSNKVKIYIKESTSSSELKIKKDEIINYTIKKSVVNTKFTLKLRKYIEIGRIVKLDNDTHKYIVTSVLIETNGNLDDFTYELEEITKQDKNKQSIFNCEKSLKLEGQVTNIKDPNNKGQIQVKFIDKLFEDMDTKERLWLPYRSEYSGKDGGIVFIPDVDDIVEVIINNGKAYVDSTLRKNTLNDECKKVEEKYIGNNMKQRIFWKDKSLELFSFENKIVMDKDKIELCVGKNKITVTEKEILLETSDADNQIKLSPDGILLSTKKDIKIKNNNLIVKSDKDIELQSNNFNAKSNSNTHIEASSSIEMKASSEVKVNASSKLSLKGSTVNIC